MTAKILERAKKLKVVGRAGIGVDNVDIPAATAKGIIVMNTPFGNSITTAEHAITLMLSLARQIPQADASTQAGKWEKNHFMGVEISGKTLGIIGCGNIGAIVADRALGLNMKVIAYDPFFSTSGRSISASRRSISRTCCAARISSRCTRRSPKRPRTSSTPQPGQDQKGVRLINCARGGLVDEAASYEALESGHIAGAAFDVFADGAGERKSAVGIPNVVCTPHLGASTTEAQENVALQIAEQMADYLVRGAITNAVNFPSISAEEAPSSSRLLRSPKSSAPSPASSPKPASRACRSPMRAWSPK